MRFVIASAALVASFPALAQKVEPGEWQIISIVTSPAMPKPEKRLEKHCVKQEDVDDPNRWVGQMGPDCQVTPGAKGADSYSWQVSCPKSGVHGRGTMRWTRTTMEIDMDLSSKLQGKTVEIHSNISGKRIGPCKG